MVKKANKSDKKNAQNALPQEVLAIDAQYERGNFAGVRKLAAASGGLALDHQGHIDAVVEKTRTDPHAWMIGVAALFVVLVVAAMTLSAA